MRLLLPLTLPTKEYSKFLACYGKALKDYEDDRVNVISTSAATLGDAFPPTVQDGFREIWQSPARKTRLIGRKHDGSLWWSDTGGQAWNRAQGEEAVYGAAVNHGITVHNPTPIARIHYAISKFTGTAWDAIRSRLLKGDPDWQEFKNRWAEEFGPLGDETA